MAQSNKVPKTNAVRLVEQQKIPFTLIEYPIDDHLLDGVSVAEKTGQSADTVFKTLVTQSNQQEIFIFLVPVTLELDFKKAAKAANVKKIELLPLQKLTKVTGYIRGGCSPIGMIKKYPTFIDQSIDALSKVTVSAGMPGLQMTLSPKSLQSLIKGTVTPLQK